MKLPQNLSEIKFANFNNWQIYLFNNPEATEIEQVRELMGLGVADTAAVASLLIKAKRGYFDKLINGINSRGGATSSVFNICGQNVSISANENIFNNSFGGNQMMLELHTNFMAQVFDDPTNKAFIESVQGKDAGELTAEQDAALSLFQAMVISEYYKILPKMYAWYLIGKAMVPANDTNFASALATINEIPCTKLFVIQDAFFLNQAMYSIFRPYSQFALLQWQWSNSWYSSKGYTSILRYLMARL